MPKKFKDLLSHNSVSYSRHRPDYPDLLFKYLSSVCRQHRLAWDTLPALGKPGNKGVYAMAAFRKGLEKT